MRWNIDPSHSTAEFSIRHLMITNVKGRFGALTGTVELDADHPESSVVAVTIDATSIDTRDDKRDAHLRSPDFFDVAQFPTLTFQSTKVTRTDDGFEVVGDLTIRGITKAVTLEVEGLSNPSKDPWGNTRVGTSAKAKINRKDWGLLWNAALETGGVLVGEQIKISIDVSLIAAAAAIAA
ncbi:MAG: YceI family protein [Proteobacteria bacterium]|nr:YceI family protein [Pseudomonadota bacterium]